MLQQSHPQLVMTLPMVRYATSEQGLLKHWYRRLVPKVWSFQRWLLGDRPG
jgi:hypothetical protein